jgi:hypothetical protein
MGAMSFRGRQWSTVWRDFRERLAPRCGYCECVHAKSTWRKMRRRSGGVRLRGARYCRTECLELALIEVLGQARREPGCAAVAAHRIPLGLLLLSRKQLTAPQLRTALEAQRAAGEGESRGESGKKIGAWLQELGFATEHQITSALACQWSCPMLRTGPGGLGICRFPCIPALLLESFRMVPVELVGPLEFFSSPSAKASTTPSSMRSNRCWDTARKPAWSARAFCRRACRHGRGRGDRATS